MYLHKIQSVFFMKSVDVNIRVRNQSPLISHKDIKISNKLVSIALLMFLMNACEKEPHISLEISIVNRTTDTISLNLLPQPKYIIYPGFYQYCDSKQDPYPGPFAEVSSDLEPEGEKSLFSSENIAQEPYSVATRVFESISISIHNGQKKIYFSVDTAKGYSENLYDSTSIWDYEVLRFSEPDQFRSNPMEIHSYTFAISTDKIEY